MSSIVERSSGSVGRMAAPGSPQQGPARRAPSSAQPPRGRKFMGGTYTQLAEMAGPLDLAQVALERKEVHARGKDPRCVARLNANKGSLYACAFTESGSKLVVGGAERVLKVYDVQTLIEWAPAPAPPAAGAAGLPWRRAWSTRSERHAPARRASRRPSAWAVLGRLG
ncbi:unnamed protein product, partial [Prorocentrum cordatum]